MACGSAEPVTSLYAHVPFCVRKCDYCGFFSESGQEKLIERYAAALNLEMAAAAGHGPLKTIFFGGGTPSLLPSAAWAGILETMARLQLLPAAELSIECNPATVSLEKARLWRSYGVNRLSLGVQSLHDPLLARLGRIHNRQKVLESFELFRKAGFDNINLDLMFAIPGQTLEIWRETLRQALDLQPEHLACYELIYEEDTPFFHKLQLDPGLRDDELAADMYEAILDEAAHAGLAQYEVANFARAGRAGDSRTDGSAAAAQWASPPANLEDPPEIPAMACWHNVNYWRGGSFFGFGASASGFVAGARTRNCADTVRYCELIEGGRSPVESQDTLPPLSRAAEIAAFGLRMSAGWPLDLFEARTGFNLAVEWNAEVEQLVRRGWARLTARQFWLTAQGLRFADEAARLFLR